MIVHMRKAFRTNTTQVTAIVILTSANVATWIMYGDHSLAVLLAAILFYPSIAYLANLLNPIEQEHDTLLGNTNNKENTMKVDAKITNVKFSTEVKDTSLTPQKTDETPLPEPEDCYDQQSPTDAPGMKGDRSRAEDGRLREVRSDEQLQNNPTIKARAPELLEKFAEDFTVGQLRDVFGGMSLSQITDLTKDQRAKVLEQERLTGGITAQMAKVREI